jgi:hypothetical protein
MVLTNYTGEGSMRAGSSDWYAARIFAYQAASWRTMRWRPVRSFNIVTAPPPGGSIVAKDVRGPDAHRALARCTGPTI